MLGYLKKVAKLESFKRDTSIHPTSPSEEDIEAYQSNSRPSITASVATPTTICPTIASALWRPLWPPGPHSLS